MLKNQYIGETWKHIILIIGALVVLLPFYMVVSISLKSQQEIQSISGGLIGAQETQTFPVCTKMGMSVPEAFVALHSRAPYRPGSL